MAKDKSIYTCTECGGTSPKWLGKCPNCEAWNTLVESVEEGASKNRYQVSARGLVASQPVMTLGEIEATDVDRQPTGVDELDRVLGGGIVAGGVVLIGGDPGIGKSTLLLQALVDSVAAPPKARRPTKPTYGSKQRRLEGKSQRAVVKAGRGKVSE